MLQESQIEFNYLSHASFVACMPARCGGGGEGGGGGGGDNCSSIAGFMGTSIAEAVCACVMNTNP